jgi:hypothetical protein
MSIDRIGKGAPAAPADAGVVGRPGEAARPFEVEKGGRVARAQVEATASGPLDQLRAGTIDVGRYLDLKVDEATAHLSALPRVELDAIRGALRDRLATDPALVDLVRTATGGPPRPPDDA